MRTAIVAADQVLRHLGRKECPRHAGAWVRAAARVVEPGDGAVAIRLAEVGRLLQRGLDGERIPVGGEEDRKSTRLNSSH